MTLEDLEVRLRGTGVDDVLFAGFIDPEEVPITFYPSQCRLYLRCSSVTVELEAVRTTGTLAVSLVNDIRYPDVEEDELTPVVTSIMEQALGGFHGPRLASLHLLGVSADADPVICLAVAFVFANGHELFVDPTYIFGIRLGAGQRQIWLENWPGAPDAQETVIPLGP